MFVSDIGVGWICHDLFRNQFLVKDDYTIANITASGIREVYIDPTRGLDAEDAKEESTVVEELEEEMRELDERLPSHPSLSIGAELGQARRVSSQARGIVRDIMADVRLGRQVKIEQAEPVVENMMASILRNNDALLSICRIKDKNGYTFHHSVSVAALLIAFCRSMQLDTTAMRMAGIGGLLHDIGKVCVPDEILNHPGKLDDDSFKIMKHHVSEGRDILAHTEGVNEISIQVAHQHHERDDGSGYPLGLKGDEISTLGQMAAICDVYDAITSDRCYHKGMPPHEALRKLLEWSRFHFNPAFVHSFIRTIGIYPSGTLVMLESGRVGVVLDQSEGKLLQPKVRIIYDSRKQMRLPSTEIDLSRPVGHGGGDRIIGHETPERLGIDPQTIVLN